MQWHSSPGRRWGHLEAFQIRGDVALGDGGQWAWWSRLGLDLEILEAFYNLGDSVIAEVFSNPNGSVILFCDIFQK